MDSSTLIKRLETAKSSFQNLELQLADPDVASDPKQLETIARAVSYTHLTLPTILRV